MEQGLTIAQSNLGACYYDIQDYEKAVYWFNKAAEQGNTIAQYGLGLCYQNGNGVSKNVDNAIYWFEKAAASNYDIAQIYLASIYYESPDIAGNYVKAVKYLTMARKSNDKTISGSACNLLSKCYRFGRGVPQDVSKADELQTEAEAKGSGEDIGELMKKLKEEYSIIK